MTHVNYSATENDRKLNFKINMPRLFTKVSNFQIFSQVQWEFKNF